MKIGKARLWEPILKIGAVPRYHTVLDWIPPEQTLGQRFEY